jgi:hypothetical protein
VNASLRSVAAISLFVEDLQRSKLFYQHRTSTGTWALA